jgi:TM2 domain-containing membrane protein YozV
MNKYIESIIFFLCLILVSSLTELKKETKAVLNKTLPNTNLLENKEKLREKTNVQIKSQKFQKILEQIKNTKQKTNLDKKIEHSEPIKANQKQILPALAYSTSFSENSQVQVVNPNPNPKDKFNFIRNIKCNNQNCNVPFAVCTDTTTCSCLSAYANFVPADNPNTGLYCNYLRYKQLVAFLLEFFLSFGIGHFYCGRIVFGVIKLLCTLVPFMLGIVMFCSSISKESDCCGLALSIFTCLFLCAIAIWQIVDLIMFGLNSYADGNGVPLKPW